MQPRHVPLRSLLIGLVVYGAAVGLLDLIQTRDATITSAASAMDATDRESAAADLQPWSEKRRPLRD